MRLDEVDSTFYLEFSMDEIPNLVHVLNSGILNIYSSNKKLHPFDQVSIELAQRLIQDIANSYISKSKKRVRRDCLTCAFEPVWEKIPDVENRYVADCYVRKSGKYNSKKEYFTLIMNADTNQTFIGDEKQKSVRCKHWKPKEEEIAN